MSSAAYSIPIRKNSIKIFDLTDTGLNIEECINNANDILIMNPEQRLTKFDSLQKMRINYLSENNK